MAAPDHVPTDPTKRVRAYSSPPRRTDAWIADRAGDLDGRQPKGAKLGTAGPDQGYAYRLVHLFDDRLHLNGVDRDDAVAGCVALAMKRSALFGRAPVVHDLTAAFTIYGFLDQNPPEELSTERRELFAEVKSNHHYSERRHLVDRVSEEQLLESHDAIATQYQQRWQDLFS
ncbi:MAG: hypothetical protein ACR2QK_20155 [Acidimicrobiales bacterium]